MNGITLLQSKTIQTLIANLICAIAVLVCHNLPPNFQSQVTDIISLVFELLVIVLPVVAGYYRAKATQAIVSNPSSPIVAPIKTVVDTETTKDGTLVGSATNETKV